MELLVRRFDFMTAAHGQRQEFKNDIKNHKDKYEAVVNEDDILASFKVLRKGVCRPDFPGESSHQFYFAGDVLDELMEWSTKLKESNKIISLDGIHDSCFEFLYDLIRQGPGTSHVQLWERMFCNSDFNFQEYYFNLKGDKLKNHIRFLMREFRTQEPGPDRNRYDITMPGGFHYLVDKDTFSEESFKEAQVEFAELYIYMELTFLMRPEEVRKIHHSLSQALWYKYDRNLFKGFDLSKLKYFLKRLEDIICKMNLTALDETQLKKLIDIVNMLMSAIA